MTQKVECFLETYEGTKEAYAYLVDNSKACVQAKDGSYAIPITRGTFERKFEYEAKPTFYAC